MIIGERHQRESIVQNQWGPEDAPSFPMPGRNGRRDKPEIYRFVDHLRERIPEWTSPEVGGDIVKEVYVLKTEKMGSGEGDTGMLLGVGAIKTKNGDYPITPLMWMIPIRSAESLKNWGDDRDPQERVAEFKKLLSERLVEKGEERMPRTVSRIVAGIVNPCENRDTVGGPGNLITVVGGHSHNPLFVIQQVPELIESAMAQGVDPQSLVILAMGTQGTLGTTFGEARAKSMEMISAQIQDTFKEIVDRMFLDLIAQQKTCGIDAPLIKKMFWERLSLVVGHSMGAWEVLKWKMIYNEEIKKLNGGEELKIMMMDSVSLGSNPPESDVIFAREHFGIEPDEPNVLLLTAFCWGWLVKNIDKLLKYPVVRDVAEMLGVIQSIVSIFMGKEQDFETTLHSEVFLHDLPTVVANNAMLTNVGLPVKTIAELEQVQEWVRSGKVLFGVGGLDKILAPKVVKKFVAGLGGDASMIIDTIHHYPGADILARALKWIFI